MTPVLPIAVGCLLFQTTVALPEETDSSWYLARYGSEPCVLVDNTWGGSVHTPQQLESLLQAHGRTISNVEDKNGMFSFKATQEGGQHTNIMMFSSHEFCKKVMSSVKED
jgi:hypothetical protein